ncbi:response regulator transcription factor [Achromobacter seleniivolatilans]|uniref:Response regulator transcription factor n=1 Tax=Achromobacter seleniivolatilans TaxID=3047478 RepID=A0ABY9M4E6_9BURK|nr:response regulator transcription factor [Achromobacter sp. R39]WMD21585.1 response regulator transcription factor [Achromobacter sp. R39]
MPADSVHSPFLLRAPVLLLEDEPLISLRLEGLLLRLGYTRDDLVFASTLAEGRACAARLPIAVALVDLGLPDGNGLELIAEMHAANRECVIVVVSAWSSEDTILAALRAGAVGYVLKERDDLEVLLSIRSALQGGAAIDPFIARRLIQEFRSQPAAASGADIDSDAETESSGQLSRRETQILRMVAEGLGNREIAEQLTLSRHTVERHIKHVYRKLRVSSRTKAIHTARVSGLIN